MQARERDDGSGSKWSATRRSAKEKERDRTPTRNERRKRQASEKSQKWCLDSLETRLKVLRHHHHQLELLQSCLEEF